MTRFSILMAIFFISIFSFHDSFSAPGAELIPFKISGVYVPEGFDDNDNLQVVIEGYFPNGCFKIAPPTFSLTEGGTFKIQANAYRYDGFCIQMLVPFHQVVDLGIHDAREYLIQAAGQREVKRIKVSPSENEGPDDYLYAPVKQIYISRDPKQSSRKRILLSGEFSLSCLMVEKVLISQKDNTIVVQPVADVRENVECKEANIPFEQSELLPDLKPGRYLVHVRTLNGNSLNRIIELN